MARTDAHRPSAIQPSEYEFIVFVDYSKYSGISGQLRIQQQAIRDSQARTGGTWAKRENNGNCHVCGAIFSYGAVYRHRPTNEYVSLGHICADKLEFSLDGAEFRSWKKRILAGHKTAKGRAAAERILTESGCKRAWEINALSYNDLTPSQRRPYGIITDIVGRAIRYGSVSPKQIDFLQSLQEQFDRKPIERAPVEPGNYIGTVGQRDVFDLTLVGIGSYESDYGTVTVYIFEDANGNSVVWSSTGRGLWIDGQHITKGARVRVKATVKAHTVYKGRNQTRLLRVVLEEAVAA